MKTASQMRVEILEKAAEDEGFRAKLLLHPRRAVSEHFGMSVPEGFDIRVVEDTADTTNLVLPPSARLEEEHLAAISGASQWVSGDPTDDNDRNTNAPQWWDSNNTFDD